MGGQGRIYRVIWGLGCQAVGFRIVPSTSTAGCGKFDPPENHSSSLLQVAT